MATTFFAILALLLLSHFGTSKAMDDAQLSKLPRQCDPLADEYTNLKRDYEKCHEGQARQVQTELRLAETTKMLEECANKNGHQLYLTIIVVLVSVMYVAVKRREVETLKSAHTEAAVAAVAATEMASQAVAAAQKPRQLQLDVDKLKEEKEEVAKRQAEDAARLRQIDRDINRALMVNDLSRAIDLKIYGDEEE